jgi:CRISPR-associated protein Cas1
MNSSTYRTARALYPHRRDVWEREEEAFLYEPLPPAPVDHPELALFAGDAGAGLAEVSHSDGAQTQAEARARPPGRLDEPMPARMLNEYVYCPRLFYYEYGEGVFVESEDTERGTALHKKVDRGRGKLAPARQRAAADAADADAAEAIPAQPAGAGGEANANAADQPNADPARGAKPAADVLDSRSVTLGSERLGVVAKMDLIEVELEQAPEEVAPPAAETAARRGRKAAASAATKAGEEDLFSQASATAEPGAATIVKVPAPVRREIRRVTPVDYKAGAPLALEDGNALWDADKMQLGLQMLILRDNGYACEEGVIYYRRTKQRVGLTMSAELEAWLLAKIAEARQTAAGTMPPPLVNSPKCVRCSLAPVCLPDETRLLASALAETAPSPAVALGPARDGGGAETLPRLAKAPRQLIAARDDERALYLTTQGCRVTLRGEVLVVKDEDGVLGEFRVQDVSHLALFGNIQVTTQALHCLCDAEVPVAYFSMGGWFYGLTRGHGLKNVYGNHLQYSIFECDLNPRERGRLEEELKGLIKAEEDQVLFVSLGPAEDRGDRVITALGLPYVHCDAPCYVV